MTEIDRVRDAIAVTNRRIREELVALNDALPDGLQVDGLDVEIKRLEHYSGRTSLDGGPGIEIIAEVSVATRVNVRPRYAG